ncbi:MAG: Signal-transduction histidine kinase senX3 [Planctomycetes bacterium ADurb.Bin126]|nr:MAG: Signal-transduction histidine kinase senX3 [Planctomycetes bacterium ADurb.Bin126]HOD83794.1 sensor histidine kinase [Phycisphaerae bacterium]
MKFGIRFKLVALLTVVALLPLTAAVLTISAGARELRTESFGLLMQSKAAGEAMGLSISLSKDIEKLRLVFQDDAAVARLLGQRTTRPASSDRTRPERGIIAERLRVLRRTDPRVAAVVLTDRSGNLVASSGAEAGEYLREEPWWKAAWADGEGKVFITSVRYDQAAGVYSANICMPIYLGEQVVGVVQMTLDVSRWLATLKPTVGTHDVSVMLVEQDGRIAYWDDVRHRGLPMRVPLVSRASEWYGPVAEQGSPGWRLTKDHEVQGYASLVLPEVVARGKVEAPPWTLVLYVPTSQALGPLHNLSVITLLVGLGLVGTIFLVGLIVVEGGFIRRIQRLQHATHRVAQGDLSHRVQSARKGWLGGVDEVDELGDDFNRMIAKVQQSHEALRQASELKTNFIRIAGHELRTPVAYLLALCKMLRDSRDTDRLIQALQTVGARAKRLDEIIQAMFKIMPDQAYAEELHFSQFPLSELLEEIYLACHPFIESRSQHLIIDHAEKGLAVTADRQKLYDMIENLVTNAIKFTPDGGTIRVTAGRQLGQYVTIAVTDQGPGISPQDLPHIFEPFYSTSDVMKHSTGTSGYQKRGIGLGLTIVKHFAGLHHGSVHASSSPEGSTFTISIPASPLDEHARPSPPQGDGI